MDRIEIGRLIEQRLTAESASLQAQWREHASIRHCFVDDLLPPALAQRIHAAFPPPSSMMLRKNLRELKYVSAQMDQHDRLLEEIVFAFQQPGVLEQVRVITGLRSLYPDEHLYAGGISVMGQGHFLNPHLDNSHDKDRERYRVLNLLYYVSPDWSQSDGANLELWPQGPQGEPITVVSRFNRLALMVTDQSSWHSVSPNRSERARCCVSNYYFSDHPVGDADYFHPTSFRGRPEQRVRDLALRADASLRGWVRKLFPKGLRATRHVYRRDR